MYLYKNKTLFLSYSISFASRLVNAFTNALVSIYIIKHFGGKLAGQYFTISNTAQTFGVFFSLSIGRAILTNRNYKILKEHKIGYFLLGVGSFLIVCNIISFIVAFNYNEVIFAFQQSKLLFISFLTFYFWQTISQNIFYLKGHVVYYDFYVLCSRLLLSLTLVILKVEWETFVQIISFYFIAIFLIEFLALKFLLPSKEEMENKKGWDLKNFYTLIQDGLSVHIDTISGVVAFPALIFFSSKFVPSSLIAEYTFCFQISMALILFTSSMSGYVIKWIGMNLNEKIFQKKIRNLLTILTLFNSVAIIIVVLAKSVILNLLNKNINIDLFILIPILLFSYSFIFSVILNPLWIKLNKGLLISKFSLLNMFVCFLLGFFLIPKFKIVGMIITQSWVYSLSILFNIYLLSKLTNNE